MSDEGFREIQLGGKQLVFLFMAVTVAGVVVFLLGVMVGRDLRLPLAAGATGIAPLADTDPTASLARPRVTGAASASRSTPLSTRETLTYAERLESPGPPPETLNEPIPFIEDSSVSLASRSPEERPSPAQSTAPPAAPRSSEPPTLPAPRAAIAPTPDPSEGAFVVQVAAFRQRTEADSVARRLAARGYPVFVTTVTSGGTAQAFYRVRVGKYGSLQEAEAVARRLEKEEQFRPWIDRS
jgi:DedD protein